MPALHGGTVIATAQTDLFGSAGCRPPGLRCKPAIITPAEEAKLVALLATLPLRHAQFQGYTARRRVQVYGGMGMRKLRNGAGVALDAAAAAPDAAAGEFGVAAVAAAAPDAAAVADLSTLPAPLAALRLRLAQWSGIAEGDFVHLLVSEYQPGAPLGWHRDAPAYAQIVGISLAGPARLRLRRWQAVWKQSLVGSDAAANGAGGIHRGSGPEDNDRETIALDLAPRSAYLLCDWARWGWQHCVPPVLALRYSVTLRTGV